MALAHRKACSSLPKPSQHLKSHIEMSHKHGFMVMSTNAHQLHSAGGTLRSLAPLASDLQDLGCLLDSLVLLGSERQRRNPSACFLDIRTSQQASASVPPPFQLTSSKSSAFSRLSEPHCFSAYQRHLPARERRRMHAQASHLAVLHGAAKALILPRQIQETEKNRLTCGVGFG